MSQIENKLGTPVSAGPSSALTLARYWTVVGTHVVIDLFPIFFSSLLLVLRNDLNLTDSQVKIVYALTPLFSGPPQILFAWLSDKFDTRVFGPIGLLVGGVCISSIGFAENFWQLIALEVVGVLGVGAYHPIAVSLAGELGGRAMRHGRAWAVSIFFAGGMLGRAVELDEVVLLVLELGALDDGEAHAGEDLDELAADARDDVPPGDRVRCDDARLGRVEPWTGGPAGTTRCTRSTAGCLALFER